jgi:predicted membrane channel-forming protein YqfA (hemolysin III family)
MTYTDHLISLGIGVAGYFLSLLIHRLWSKITTTETQRRLKDYEAEKAKLDNLSKSDRALIIHGFQAIFAVFALLFVVFGFQTILATKGLDESVDGREILQLLIWLIACLLCIGAAMSFQRIADYPKSLEKIDAKIAKLRERISPNREQ